MWPPPDALCSFWQLEPVTTRADVKMFYCYPHRSYSKCAKGTTMTKLRFVQAKEKKMFKMFSFLEHDFLQIIIVWNI